MSLFRDIAAARSRLMGRSKRRSRQRGATLTEYAVVMSVLVTATIGGIEAMSQESGEFLIETGSQIGERRYVRDEIASMTLPDPPEWIVQPAIEEVLRNLALDATASSSPLGYGTDASDAIDGNTDGHHGHGSVTHSISGSNANGLREWVGVDLGIDNSQIQEIVIWNRTNCCSQRLKDVYIVVSDQPILGTTLAQAEASAGSSSYHLGAGSLGESTGTPINRSGRYIRVFGADDEYLSIAEIEVNGIASSG